MDENIKKLNAELIEAKVQSTAQRESIRNLQYAVEILSERTQHAERIKEHYKSQAEEFETFYNDLLKEKETRKSDKT